MKKFETVWWKRRTQYYGVAQVNRGFPDGSVGKESTCNAGDPGLTPRSGRSAGERIGYLLPVFLGFPGDSDGKEFACNAGYSSSIPELGRSPGEKNGNQLQYSCLENFMDEEEPGGLQSMGLQRVRHD